MDQPKPTLIEELRTKVDELAKKCGLPTLSAAEHRELLVKLCTAQAEVILASDRATASFLKAIGQAGRCKGCRREIWWFKTRLGKPAPYTSELVNHFADCPAAQRFRKGGGE